MSWFTAIMFGVAEAIVALIVIYSLARLVTAGVLRSIEKHEKRTKQERNLRQ